MSSQAIAAPAARRRAPFAPYSKWDRYFFPGMMLLILLGFVMGFGSDLISHFRTHEHAYPVIVHFHAAVFIAFLILMTTQIGLIRAGRADLHRKLGIVGVVLATVMVVLGPATAFVVQRADFGLPGSDPSFMAVQLFGMTTFFSLVVAGAWLRRNAPAHKRLMLLAILAISDAGFSRWVGGTLYQALGDGFWPFMAEFFLAGDVLILAMGAYDLITRRRLHPAYVAGACWIFAWQLTESFLMQRPWWHALTTHLVGH